MPGDERGLEQVTAAARVTADDDAPATLVAEEVPRGFAKPERELRRQLGVGDAAHAVGTEESSHQASLR